jgi:DNA-binding response OmpR family regulator
MTPSVLIIDDDAELSSLLSDYLATEGFEVTVANDGRSGIDHVRSSPPSVVLLDIMLPVVNGFEVLRRLRTFSRVPVIMLTARGDGIDRVQGLDMGADDYVPKPCIPAELAARIRAVLRRTSADVEVVSNTGIVRVGDLCLWPGAGRAEWKGTSLDLTGAEFAVLEVLAQAAGAVVDKEDLSILAFGRPLGAFDRRIDVHVSGIRQKLTSTGENASWIRTVRGKGYQWVKT